MIRIELPAPPNRANFRGQTKYVNFDKRAYFDICEKYLLVQRKNLGKLPWDKIRWKAHVEVRREYDADNLVSLCKWPIDLLVRTGLLVDDGPKHAWPSAWPTQEVVSRKDRRIFIEIEPEAA